MCFPEFHDALIEAARELKALGYNRPVGVEANPSGPEREAAIRLAESDNWSS